MSHADGQAYSMRACGAIIAAAWFAVFTAPRPALAAEPTVEPSRVEAIAKMLPPQPAGVGRLIADRAAWAALAKRPSFGGLVADAEKLLGKPLLQTSDDLYLDYSRTGNRTHWQDVNSDRRHRLTALVLAEGLENQGRFLPALKTAVESICAEQTWVMPAHDPRLTNFKGQSIDIDLGSSNLAWTLATVDWLLGDSLDAATRQLIRRQIRTRILDPFKAMAAGQRVPNWWMLGTNNWNAVCLAGVTGAALAQAESREERAFFVAAAERYSQSFLAGFAADGYCTEGVGYWNYGYGHYLMLAETILQATGGRVDLLTDERARRAAMYGTRIEIVPGLCPAFADCDVHARPANRWLEYISRRWGLGLRAAEDAESLSSPGSLFETGLFAFGHSLSQTQPALTAWAGPGQRTWFDEAGILIARPGAHSGCRLAVALKGGHNAEHHNHNDVGSYVVVVGQKVVLVDPGAEVYTARTFGSRRYDSNLLNSFGHPVPLVAGKRQQPGSKARGRVVRTEFTDEADTLVLDIRSAYNVPTLVKLERTFTYSRRGTGSLTITDEAVFNKPQTFGTALITFGKWQKTESRRLRIDEDGESVEVAIEAGGCDTDVRAEEIHEDATAKRTPVRIGIDFGKPMDKFATTLRITPLRK